MNERILKECGINMLSKTLVDLEKMENKDIPDDWYAPYAVQARLNLRN